MIEMISGAINTNREGFAEMVASRDRDAVLREARFAEGCEANWIGLNCACRNENETEDLLWLAKTIQDEIKLPLCIDSLNPAAVEAVLAVHRHGRPVVDSLNCEETRMDTFLPLMKKYDAVAICLLMQEGKMAYEVEERLACLLALRQKLEKYGVAPGDIYLDPLVFAISTGDQYAKMFLKILQAVKQQHPEFKTCCGLDNISHGMPLPESINESFLVNCMCAGIDAVMVIPTKKMHSFMRLQDIMQGADEDSLDFIHAYREGFME